MKLAHRPLRFVHGLHLHESETLRALIMFIAHHFGVLHVADAVEEIKQIAFRGIERQISDVKPRRSDFDRFRFTWGSRLWARLRSVALFCFGRALVGSCEKIRDS